MGEAKNRKEEIKNLKAMNPKDRNPKTMMDRMVRVEMNESLREYIKHSMVIYSINVLIKEREGVCVKNVLILTNDQFHGESVMVEERNTLFMLLNAWVGRRENWERIVDCYLARSEAYCKEHPNTRLYQEPCIEKRAFDNFARMNGYDNWLDMACGGNKSDLPSWVRQAIAVA